MPRLAQTEGLTEVQTEILAAVKEFVDNEIIPVAQDLEHADEYPTAIVEGMKEMGIFGLMIPEEYGGLGESMLTYALCVEEIARGWMSVSGVVNTHFIVAYMIMQHGTDEQKAKYLPRMATGEVRGAFSMSEPHCGSDVAAITSKAVPNAEGGYTLNGQKMWLTNGGSSTLVAVLVRTDADVPEGASVYKKMSTFLIEKPTGFGEVLPGLTIPGKIAKMGYKGVDTTELIMDEFQLGADDLLGGVPGKGFYQMMDGVEVGRVNVAARACGLAARAFELGVEYAQQRQTFGKADRRAPGRGVPAGGHGRQGRGRPPDDGPRRPQEGLRRAQRPRGRHGQVPGQRVLQGGRRGLVPDPRRLRLRQGVRDRAALPRGPDAADRRGHRRHPADDHRPPPARGLQAALIHRRPCRRRANSVPAGRSPAGTGMSGAAWQLARPSDSAETGPAALRRCGSAAGRGPRRDIPRNDRVRGASFPGAHRVLP